MPAMSVWGKLWGGVAGLAIGGPLGALVGAVAGHYAIDRSAKRAGQTAEDGAPEEQIAFTMGVIALGAKMAKADGVVTRDEVDAFKQVFVVPDRELKNVARVFNLAKQDVAGYDAYAKQLAGLFKSKPAMLEDILDGLFHIAKADSVVHDSELDYLSSVAGIFGLSGGDFDRIKARHVPPDESDPYLVLGISRDADDAQVKRIYRQLVRDNHPDRLIARGVPEEFVAIANEKIAAINVAYDRIEKERGF